MKYNLVVVLIGLFILTSCSTRKEIVYFQGSEKLENMKSIMKFEPVFEVNDNLHVKVSSLNEEVVAPFQMNAGGQSLGGGGGQNASSMGYMVDIDGNIQFPVLGKIAAAGASWKLI